MTDHSQTQRADAQFKKLQRAEDGKKAMAEYEAERAAVAAKTERLRALRLAHEAEVAATAKAAPDKPAVTKSSTAAAKTASAKKTAPKKTSAKKTSAKKTGKGGRDEDGCGLSASGGITRSLRARYAPTTQNSDSPTASSHISSR